ncbi:MAG: hypothetical protein IJE46_01230 [Clostridia bacterium]|nr:hypothetical protein [Clostridia bacterium]
MQYTVAGFNIDVISEHPSYIFMRMKDYQSTFSGEADFTIRCKEEKNIALPDGLVHVGERVGRWLWFKKNDGTFGAYIKYTDIPEIAALVDWDENFKNISLSVYDVEPFGGLPIAQRIFYLLGDVFTYSVLSLGAGVFHSSAISYKEKGILFSAPSGTGKSTHTSLWKDVFKKDVSIFNDDTPILKIENNVCFAYGSPWSGKTAINKNIKVPLKAIVSLDRAEKNSAKKLTGLDAFYRVFNEFRKPPVGTLMENCLTLIDGVLERVPVFELLCNKEKDAVTTIYNAVGFDRE